MLITSDIRDLPRHLIRNICRWHCAEENLSPDRVGNIHVTWKDAPLDDYYFGEIGNGKGGKKVATIRLGRFPKSDSRGISDRMEAIVHFTAWILSEESSSQDTQLRCSRRLEAFKADRDNLLTEWLCPPKEPKRRPWSLPGWRPGVKQDSQTAEG